MFTSTRSRTGPTSAIRELMYYRDLADDFAKAADRLMDHAVNDEKLTEICHEKRKAKIPK